MWELETIYSREYGHAPDLTMDTEEFAFKVTRARHYIELTSLRQEKKEALQPLI